MGGRGRRGMGLGPQWADGGDVWGVLISPVNGCPRHREVSAAHSQRHGGLVAGLVLGFAARRRRPEVRSEKMRKNVQVRIMNQQK